MTNLTELQNLVDRFHANINFYKDTKNSYNEHSCRIEYIDPLLKVLGWDVANEKGLAPQYREVIAENYSTRTDRPDYTITLRGVPKFFVEAKKPAVDITRDADPAIQTRKYGWNAKHRLAFLTNFEYLAIYDPCHIAHEDDGCAVARYRLYHYTEYVEKIEEIVGLIARDTVYSGDFDAYLDENFPATGGQTQQVDTMFLSQINEWRVALSNELYAQGSRYASLEVLNDVVQEFINQIVFLRICEDKNLPLYHKLKDTITDSNQMQSKLEELFRSADRRYNSGMFSGEDIIFDLSCEVIKRMIEDLYYPQSPYLFNIIEPNLLGKIYEIFLTEQLVLLENNTIGLGKKKDCQNRSVVTTPTEIVKYMVDKTLSKVCEGKTPSEILNISVADIACGSGIFLEEAFAYLQDYCVQWYICNGQTDHLIETGIDLYKLPLQEKKDILCSLIESASRNINYMVNIGPMADGTIPAPSIDILRFVGNWMTDNSESIYGTKGNPFNDNFPWGYVTRKGNNLYLHLAQCPQNNRIQLKGLYSDIRQATILATQQPVTVNNQSFSKTIILPKELDYETVPVVKLVCATPLKVDTRNFMNEGIISIPAASGTVKAGPKGKTTFSEGGTTENFNPQTGSLLLKCEEYEVKLYTSRHWRKSFAEGTFVTLKIGDNILGNRLLKKDGELANVRQNSYPETWSTIGTVTFKKKGTQNMELSIDKIGTFTRLGFFGEDLQGESENNIRIMKIELIHKTK